MSFPWVRSVGAGSLAGVLLVACGGTSTSGVGAGDGGAADASTDVTSAPETGGDSAGNDGPTGDVGTPGETGAPEGGDDAGCTGTGTTCRTCCRMDDAAGYKKLVTAELACACKASVCGPLDGGAGDAGGSDASDLGVGACAGTCGGTTLPDATCDKCLTDATGSMADPGECYTPVSTACQGDTDCVAYVTCLMGCQ
jgi:hypothetical protein